MALDREDTLKKAEKLLRQGRLDAAIAEYVRVVEDQPRDWNSANALGDLYARAGQADKAIAQYIRIADHFLEDGFYPKAAALFKKILKIKPDDEAVQLKLAELSATQGLLADARTHFNAIAGKRRARGDKRGAEDIVIRLGDLDPADVDARIAGARALKLRGQDAEAAAKFRALHDDLLEKGRPAEALDALREAARCDPSDTQSRVLLAKEAIAAGDLETARTYMDRQTAGSDPALLFALAEIELGAGQLEAARDILAEAVGIERALRQKIRDKAWSLAGTNPDAAYVCVDVDVEVATRAADFEEAAAVLHEFVARVPTQIPALLKLVEVCVDGGLERAMYEAQVYLADAYLSIGQAAEARVIAEDLVAREPWEPAHIERFRRALVMMRVSEPDAVIAERLSGHSPFTATDPFSDPAPPSAAPAPATESPAKIEIASTPEPAEQPEAPSPAAAAADGQAEIDLTSALGSLQTLSTPPAPPTSLDEVFKDFRTEVTRQGGADQSAQHMKLAKTYLEMGMIDEAMFSLKTASRSPRLRFESASLLGRLYRDQGDLVHSAEWLERASEAPAPDVEQGRALLYELGVTLEAVGETARALAVFLELQADAGEYRDAAARIDHLARVQTGG